MKHAENKVIVYFSPTHFFRADHVAYFPRVLQISFTNVAVHWTYSLMVNIIYQGKESPDVSRGFLYGVLRPQTSRY